MTASLDSKIRIISYNCRGWKSASNFVFNLLNDCDICMIQEHWLFKEQLQSLNICDEFSSTAVSGMVSTEFVAGRPFGGCATLYRKSLSKFITTIILFSKRFCAISLTCSSMSILLICVYLPTNYGSSQSHDLYLEVLGELKGFIEAQVFDKVIVAGDFNVDFNHPSITCAYLQALMNDLQLCAVDLLPCYNIHFTYERDDGLAHSWPDHVLTNCHCVDNISSIMCIHSPDNFSDHVPVFFELSISLPHVGGCDTLGSHGNTILHDNIDWCKIDSTSIEAYRICVQASLPTLSNELQVCSTPDCKSHLSAIDYACEKLFFCLYHAGQQCFPQLCKRAKVMPGWNDSVRLLRSKALFWNRLWSDNGCPSSGVLSQIRRKAKSRYKYAVRSLKRRKDHIVSKKISSALTGRHNRIFWQEIKRFKHSKTAKRSQSPIVDGFTNTHDIANNFRSKLSSVLNSIDEDLASFSFLQDTSCTSNISIVPQTVSEALDKLRTNKQDGSQLSSNHLLLAAPVLDKFLSKFFTVIIRHGYMPQLLRNCTLIPIPKSGKDPSKSDNYRPIALAPNLSKVLEWSILLQFGSYLSTSDLQFGFKSGASTDSCTGLLKNTIALHIRRKTKVYGCFLDASKAFDRVSHNTLFSILEKRDVPPILLRFLWSWYKDQSCTVKWNSFVSDPFGVTNGVRQGGVLSPVLFTVYLDELLQRLSALAIGCHVGHHYVGSLCYADDIALLAPSPSALRILLRECELFATDHNLIFNATKTQLICFRSSPKVKCTGKFFFSGHLLEFSDTVTHLGHVLHCSLDDSDDIRRATLEMCKKSQYCPKYFFFM